MSPRPPHPKTLFLLRALREKTIDERLALLKTLDKLPVPERVEVAMQLLEAMSETHGHATGSHAARVLSEHGGGPDLDRLRATRPRLPAFEGLRDWRWNVDQAIAAIENRAAGRCECQAAQALGQGPDDRIFRQVSSSVADFGATITLACRTCARECLVERDDSYHYPTFTWR